MILILTVSTNHEMQNQVEFERRYLMVIAGLSILVGVLIFEFLYQFTIHCAFVYMYNVFIGAYGFILDLVVNTGV